MRMEYLRREDDFVITLSYSLSTYMPMVTWISALALCWLLETKQPVFANCLMFFLVCNKYQLPNQRCRFTGGLSNVYGALNTHFLWNRTTIIYLCFFC